MLILPLRKHFNHSLLDLVVKLVQANKNHSGRARTRNRKERGIKTLDLTKTTTQMKVQEPSSNASTLTNPILGSVGSRTSLNVINVTSSGTS